jgi:hypothetical protein
MKLFSRAKDGGPKSTVTGYWLVELKRLFSVVLLRFDDGSRDHYHDHAFNSLNWVLRGRVAEHYIPDPEGEPRMKRTRVYTPSLVPILTRRDRLHRVVSEGTTWVFSLRGPWARFWHEYDPRGGRFVTMTHGRKVVDG